MRGTTIKILIVSQHVWPESFRIKQLVRAPHQSGCEVTVLTGQPNYPDGAVFRGYSWSGMTHEQHAHGYTIHRVPIIPRVALSAPATPPPGLAGPGQV